MIQICWKHDEVTVWGCRQCLKEELAKIVDASSARLGKKLKKIAVRAKPQETT